MIKLYQREQKSKGRDAQLLPGTVAQYSVLDHFNQINIRLIINAAKAAVMFNKQHVTRFRCYQL